VISLKKPAVTASLIILLTSMLIWLLAGFAVVNFFERSKEISLPNATILMLRFFWIFLVLFLGSFVSAIEVIRGTTRANACLVVFCSLCGVFIVLAGFGLVASVVPLVKL
jgi:hypothetical protein